MIPGFNKKGILPAGEYRVSIEEFKERFVYNEIRIEIFEGILKLMNDLKKIGCKVIYIDGSFVSNARFPTDADICWENKNIDMDFAEKKMPILFDLNFPRQAQHDLYMADIFPEDFDGFECLNFFQKDKSTDIPKGIIKLEII
jgi:hypothetical protein